MTLESPFDVRAFIAMTRRGEEPDAPEVGRFVAALLRGAVTEAQAAAWLMAVCCRGLGPGAAASLTRAMAASGTCLDLSGLPHTADKHSTGGVGDKTTLVAGPIAAACGCTVAKMAGRGLGHTGGTIDKLESIPGLRTDLSIEGFLAQARAVGLAVCGQTADLAPADKRLYALRNETATVESIPLIASSVMSKKLAAGAGAIVLDVKYGAGAFLPAREDARSLARLMISIGVANGRRVAAALSPMEEPLGRAVGNALEVREAIETLRGGGPADLRALSLALAARMALLSGAAATAEEACRRAEAALTSGAALSRLRAMVEAQGGATEAIDDAARLPCAALVEPYRARASGTVSRCDARGVAQAVAALGGTRVSREQGPDPAAGVVLLRKVGDAVEEGEPLAELHAAHRGMLTTAQEWLARAVTVGAEVAEPIAGMEWAEEA